MNVLKNNYVSYTEPNKPITKEKTYPRITICEWCESELEYDKSDMYAGAFGCMSLDCPCCGKATVIEDEDSFIITPDNVGFPVHFHRTSKETGAVDICDNEHIRKYLKQAIEYFRKE